MLIPAFAALMLAPVQQPTAQPAAQPSVAAETVRRYASDARQGVAVGPTDIYAVSNWSLTRYDARSGRASRRAFPTSTPAP
jgi:hypothetical protein